MIGIKAAAIGAIGAILGDVVGDTATDIAVYAAGAAGAAYLWRGLVLPLVQLIRRATTAWESLETLHDWCKGVDQRLSGLEAQSMRTDEPVQAIARELGVSHRRSNEPPDPTVD